MRFSLDGTEVETEDDCYWIAPTAVLIGKVRLVDLSEGILALPLEGASGFQDLPWRLEEGEFTLLPRVALRLVALAPLGGGFLVVPGQRLISIVRNADLEGAQVVNAKQAVTATQVCVKER